MILPDARSLPHGLAQLPEKLGRSGVAASRAWVRTGSLSTQSARRRVDHGTICGRSCANSGHYKPLAPVLIAPLSIQIRRAGVQKKFGPATTARA